MARRTWAAIRPDADGAVDDVAISGDLFRLEKMARGVWWSCIYRGAHRTCFWFRIVKGDIIVTVTEDSIGCRDDSGRAAPAREGGAGNDA